VASCDQVSGWAWDPDAKIPVKVDLRIDGKTVANMTANGPHKSHAGKGFSWPVPQTLKNGASHAATGFAFDTQTDGKSSLGERKFLCDNRTSAEGIWVTTRKDASGVEVSLPATKPPRLSLLHRHQAGDPHPVNGLTESCAELGLATFERLLGRTTWNLKGGHLQARLQVQGATVRELKAGSKGAADEDVSGPLNRICLRTQATKPAVVGTTQQVRLDKIELKAAGWTSSYSPTAQGLIFGAQAGDSLVFATRSHPAGELPGAGYIAAWRSFEHGFDAVSWQLSGMPDGDSLALELVVDGQAHAITAAGQVAGLRGKSVRMQMRATGDEPIPADVSARLDNIRVRDNAIRLEGPWRMERAGSRGFSAAIPKLADDKRPGLHVAVRHAPHDYWTTGVMRAVHATVGPPFERIRGTFRQEVPGGGFRLDILADGKSVQGWARSGRHQVDFDVPASGHQVAVAVSPIEDAELDAMARFEVLDLQVLKSGWWSASSPRCAGLRDYRPAPGAIRLETPAEHVGAKLPLMGAHRVLRRFASPQTGVRLTYRQDLDEEALRVMVLLDGVPARLIEADGKHTEKVVIEADAFRTLAVALAPRVPGLAVPRPGWAEFSDIQVHAAGSSWQLALAVPAAEPELVTSGLADAIGGDAAAVGGARGGSGGGRSGGCMAARGADGSAPLLALMIVVFAGLWRRRHSKTSVMASGSASTSTAREIRLVPGNAP